MSKLPPFPKPRWYESMRRWDLHLLAYRKGVEAEGDRIIKLLEDLDTCDCDEDDPNTKHYRCGATQGLIPQDFITLIKGENKPFITTKQAEELTNEMLEE